jgi:two-component system, NarL family, nitrate/nitrite response regulator NarL
MPDSETGQRILGSGFSATGDVILRKERAVMQRQTHTTILAGANTLLREGLARILRPPHFRVVAITANIRHLDFKSLRSYDSILLVHEIGTGQVTTIPEIRLFKERCPAARIAVLGEHDQLSEMVGAFQAGANAFFPEAVTPDALIKALQLVMLGETILPPSLLSCIDHALLGHAPLCPDSATPVGTLRERLSAVRQDSENAIHDSAQPGGERGAVDDATDDLTRNVAGVAGRSLPRLSAREHDILFYISEGASNKLIARRFGITDGTVKIHVKAILRKIGASNRTQAAIWGMNNGLLIRPERRLGPSLVRPAIDHADQGTETVRSSLAHVSQPVGKA